MYLISQHCLSSNEINKTHTATRIFVFFFLFFQIYAHKLYLLKRFSSSQSPVESPLEFFRTRGIVSLTIVYLDKRCLDKVQLCSQFPTCKFHKTSVVFTYLLEHPRNRMKSRVRNRNYRASTYNILQLFIGKGLYYKMPTQICQQTSAVLESYWNVTEREHTAESSRSETCFALNASESLELIRVDLSQGLAYSVIDAEIVGLQVLLPQPLKFPARTQPYFAETPT